MIAGTNMAWGNIGENVIEELESLYVIMKESSIDRGLMKNVLSV